MAQAAAKESASHVGFVLAEDPNWEVRLTMREKVKETIVGDAVLRLFKEGGAYKGAVIVGKTVKVLEGTDADDVWRRMHDEVGKSNPKYFGFTVLETIFCISFQMAMVRSTIPNESAATSLRRNQSSTKPHP
jgi:hypothetical protein